AGGSTNRIETSAMNPRGHRSNRTSLFDGIEEGGIRATSYSSHEIDEQENDGAIDGLQDRVSILKRLSGDIHEEVETHNRMLDRMGNDMDTSRGFLSITTTKKLTIGIIEDLKGQRYKFFIPNTLKAFDIIDDNINGMFHYNTQTYLLKNSKLCCVFGYPAIMQTENWMEPGVQVVIIDGGVSFGFIKFSLPLKRKFSFNWSSLYVQIQNQCSYLNHNLIILFLFSLEFVSIQLLATSIKNQSQTNHFHILVIALSSIFGPTFVHLKAQSRRSTYLES
ncbi:hypothetical protein ACJX0J_026843, partial [Zea mays]